MNFPKQMAVGPWVIDCQLLPQSMCGEMNSYMLQEKVAYRNQRLKEKDNKFFDVQLGAKGFLIQWLLFNNELKFEYWPFLLMVY